MPLPNTTNSLPLKLALFILMQVVPAWLAFGQPIYTPYAFTTIAGTPGNAGNTNGPALAAQFNYPWGVAVDQAGNIFVSEPNSQTIRKITSGAVSTFITHVYGQQLAVDGSGNIYIGNSDIEVLKITPSGTVSILAGGSDGSADGTGSAAQFRGTSGIAVDSVGNVYVAEEIDNTIRKVCASRKQFAPWRCSSGGFG
jgi:hypothetical protein